MGRGRAQIPWRVAPSLVLLALLYAPGRAAADGLLDMGWQPLTPRYAAEIDRITTVALGVALRPGNLRAVRYASRQRGELLGRRALHRYLDEMLAQRRSMPRIATTLHAVIDDHAAITGVRPLADGTALVRVAVPGDALREAVLVEGMPWSK